MAQSSGNLHCGKGLPLEGAAQGKGDLTQLSCLSEGRLWARERVELPYGALDEGGIQLDQHHGQGET